MNRETLHNLGVTSLFELKELARTSQDPGLLCQIAHTGRSSLSILMLKNNPHVDGWVIREILNHMPLSASAPNAIALHKQTLPEDLDKLARGSYASLRKEFVCINPNTSPETLLHLSEILPASVIHYLTLNLNTPGPALAQVVLKNPQIRVGNHPNCPTWLKIAESMSSI